VEQVIYLICKIADHSQLEKATRPDPAQWFWFQCIRCLSNILSSYFIFALNPKVNSASAKGTMLAKDDIAIEDITDSFQQLFRDIKSAIANNGDGCPLADSTRPIKAEHYFKAERAKLGIADHPAQQPHSPATAKKGIFTKRELPKTTPHGRQ
jgi:hypothetical protein